MRKAVLLMVLCAIVSLSVFAVRVGPIDEECQAFGFDYGVAKWQCDDNETETGEDDVWTIDGQTARDRTAPFA